MTCLMLGVIFIMTSVQLFSSTVELFGNINH